MEVCKDAVTTIERTWNRLKRETQHALSAEHATREDKAHHFMQQILLTLGERIRAKRQRKRLSQEKFAEVCGLHRTEVGLLERGQTIPRLDTLLIVSEHLGLPPSKLLKGFKHKSTLLQGLRIQAFQDHEAKS
jgi:ribosome-binding protein aMBF1 (putative translation factor)